MGHGVGERELRCSPEIILAWVWTDLVLSQNDYSTSQTFVHFGWDHLPTNPFLPQATLTGVSDPAPSPVPF